MGGALGLAVLVSLSAHRTTSLLAGGAGSLEALNGGFRVAFAAAAAAALLAALTGGALLRPRPMQAPAGDPATHPDGHPEAACPDPV